MGSVVLPHLNTAWHVDQAILSEDERLVVIRFGRDGDPDCMKMDEVLFKIADRVKNFAAVYVCDIDQVPDFNQIWLSYLSQHALRRPVSTTNHDRPGGELEQLEEKQELIDIIETIYRGAKKGRGLVVSPKDYSTRYRY
ncbi:hypothetical protein RB593_008708 [Gaeumannomyces tritici]